MMKNILAATDFSKSSQHAVDCAAQLALETNAKLLIFHSTHIPVVGDSYFDAGISLDLLQATDKENLHSLVTVLKAKYPLLKVESLVKIGFTVEMLKSLTKNGDIGMVVMGIAHLDKFSETVFGSTSTATAGELNCPVLIIPEKWKYRTFSKIAFAFDQRSIPAGTGVKVLAGMCELFNSKIDFVNVMDENFPLKDDQSLVKVYGMLGITKPRVHFLTPLKYKLVEQLKEFTRRYKSNLVVMISRQHNVFWKLFNERKTKKMAFETSVPLLVLSEKKTQ